MYEIIRDGDRPRARCVYEFAGCVVQITSLFSYMHLKSRKYEYTGPKAPDYCIETAPEDIEAERVKAMEEDRIEGLAVQNYADNYLEMTAIYRKLVQKLLDRGIFLFHGSVIAVDNEAYLFTAKSGTGKSTHTRLWRELFGDRAVMVNDDKPLLELKDGRVIAHGTPWNGKHELGTNISVPLKALCVLERGEVNEIKPMEPATALPKLMKQIYRMSDGAMLIKTLDLVEQMLACTPVYLLKCNMEPEAATVAYEGMQ